MGNIKEIWKPIVGWEDLYAISSKGRIKSLRKKKKKILCLGSSRGYSKVVLCVNGNRKIYIVHRLVAKAFISNPENKPQVNHKDGIKNNNAAENLEWCTIKENINHALCNGLMDTKLNKSDAEKIRELYLTGKYIMKDIANMYNVKMMAIWKVINYKTWNS